MEQVPTGKIDNSSPAAFAWAVMPPNPALESEMLTRLMMKFGTPEPAARAAVVQAVDLAGPRDHRHATPTARTSSRCRTRSTARGGASAWRSTAPASRWSTATARAACTSCATAIPTRSPQKANNAGWLTKLQFWKSDEKDKPEQYQIVVAESAQNSVVSVQDPGGVPDRTATSEKILALLKDQLK